MVYNLHSNVPQPPCDPTTLIMTCGAGHQRQPGEVVVSKNSLEAETEGVLTHLMAREDQRVSNHHVLTPPRDEHHHLGNVIRGQGLTATAVCPVSAMACKGSSLQCAITYA